MTMRILLDSHVFLWYIQDDPRLPASFRVALRDLANDVYLSVASIWELVIKHSIGKLPLPDSPALYLPLKRDEHKFASLPVDEAAMPHLATLPSIHRDPFDRILVSQALQFGLTLATTDPLVAASPVLLLPAV